MFPCIICIAPIRYDGTCEKIVRQVFSLLLLTFSVLVPNPKRRAKGLFCENQAKSSCSNSFLLQLVAGTAL